MECKICGLPKRIFERSTVLKLPLPPDELQQWSVTELLLLVSAREEGCNVLVDCRSEVCSLSRAEHILQRRVFTCPQVLLVHVRRTRADGTLSRFGVCVEDQISLPGCGTLVLRGVIYHRGASADSGHYTCACLGPDRCFWYFDDIHRPTRLGANISEFRVCNVVMLVYSRPDSAVHVSRAGSVQDLCDVVFPVLHMLHTLRLQRKMRSASGRLAFLCFRRATTSHWMVRAVLCTMLSMEHCPCMTCALCCPMLHRATDLLTHPFLRSIMTLLWSMTAVPCWMMLVQRCPLVLRISCHPLVLAS